MISRKVVLTYKRKRPPSRCDFSHETLSNKLAVSPNSDTSTTLEKHRELTEDRKAKNQKTDYEITDNLTHVYCLQDVGGISGNSLYSDSFSHLCHVESLNLSKDVPEGERFLSDFTKEHDISMSVQGPKSNTRKDIQLPGTSEMKELTSKLCSLLEKCPGKIGSQNDSGNPSNDSSAGKRLNDSQGGSSSSIDPGSENGSACSDKYSFSPSPKLIRGGDPGAANLELFTDGKCSLEHASPSAPEACSLKESNSSLKDKIGSSLTMNREKKLSSPLITFCRRSKRTKDVKGPDWQGNLKNENCMTAKESEHASSVSPSVVEVAPAGSSDLSKNEKYPMEGTNTDHIIASPQEKSCQELDVCDPAGSVGEIEAGVQSLSCGVAKDRPQMVEASIKAEDLEFPLVKESKCLVDHWNKTTPVPDVMGSNERFALSLNLTTPHDSQCVVDCNINLETDFDKEDDKSSRVRGILSESRDNNMELHAENFGEAQSVNQVLLAENQCNSAVVGYEGNNGQRVSPESTGVTPKNNYLQLFPEDREYDRSQIGETQQKVTGFTYPDEGNIRSSGSWHQAKFSSIKPSLFLGLSQPVEPSVDLHAGNYSSDSLNIRIQSREFMQDSVSQSYPYQTSSLLRHEMMLDNILDRAGGLRGHRSSLDQFEFPSMWLEEELDSLWVGVRRHGRGSWDSILRDPRLRFLSWRTPMDLAAKWQEEQRKLFNNLPVSNKQCSGVFFSDELNGLLLGKTGRENLVDDFQHSLRGDGSHNRSTFKFAKAHGDLYKQDLRAVASSRYRSPFYGQKSKSAFSHFEDDAAPHRLAPLTVDPPTRVGMNTCLPHWLKEAVSVVPAMSNDPSPLAMHLSANRSSLQGQSRACVESSAVHQEAWKMFNGKYATSRAEHEEAGKFPQLNRRGNSEPSQSFANKQEGLIIIESDASSEETISDDHGARP